MKIFRSFFKLHQSGILAFVLCSIVFVLIFSLYDLPVGAVLYSAVLSAVICLALFLASFIRYCKRCRMLQKMQQEITVTIQHLPQPQDCKEQAYQELETPFSETAGTGAGVAGAVQRYDGVLHCLDTSDENAYRSHAAALTGGAFTGKPCLAG